MKRNTIRFGLGSLIICFFFGCITDYSTPSRYQESNRLVVEGFITGDTTIEFILSRSVPLSADSSFWPETGATVNVRCDNGTVFGPARESTPGHYRLAMEALIPSAAYCLEFSTGGETYRSEYLAPTSSPAIDSISWHKAAAGEPLEIFVSTHDDERPDGYYLWTFQEDWEFTAQYDVHYFFDPVTHSYYEEKVNPFFFCWNKDTSKKILLASTGELAENRIVNQSIHSIPCTDVRLSYLYCITVRQRTLTAESYQYYKEKRTLNEEMGGLFTPQPSELKGNIRCVTNPEVPVIGYVDVAYTTEKRVFIDPTKIYEYIPYDCNERLKWDLPDTAMYKLDLRPIITPDSYPRPKMWANVKCVECTATGTKNKPAFWPNDHQ